MLTISTEKQFHLYKSLINHRNPDVQLEYMLCKVCLK